MKLLNDLFRIVVYIVLNQEKYNGTWWMDMSPFYVKDGYTVFFKIIFEEYHQVSPDCIARSIITLRW